MTRRRSRGCFLLRKAVDDRSPLTSVYSSVRATSKRDDRESEHLDGSMADGRWLFRKKKLKLKRSVVIFTYCYIQRGFLIQGNRT